MCCMKNTFRAHLSCGVIQAPLNVCRAGKFTPSPVKEKTAHECHANLRICDVERGIEKQYAHLLPSALYKAAMQGEKSKQRSV